MLSAGTHRSSSSQETERLGAELAAGLVPGDVVLVSGELGAGKTTFVRGACRALGVSAPVTSPTFTIGQRYPARRVAFVSHLDLYRVAEIRDEDPDLLADYVQPSTISFVEWPDGAEPALAELTEIVARVRLSHAGRDRRLLEIA